MVQPNPVIYLITQMSLTASKFFSFENFWGVTSPSLCIFFQDKTLLYPSSFHFVFSNLHIYVGISWLSCCSRPWHTSVYAELMMMNSVDFILLQTVTSQVSYLPLRRQSIGGTLTEFSQYRSLRCGQTWFSGTDVMWNTGLASLFALG